MLRTRSYIVFAAVILSSVLLVGLAWQYRSQRIEQVEAKVPERPTYRYGESAPEYSTIDHLGQPVRIKKGSDRLTLLVFFKPVGINETLTYLNAVDSRYKGKGLRIIGVSGGSVEQTDRFVSQSELQYTVVSDVNGEMHRAFKFHPDHDHGGTLLLNKDLNVEFTSERIVLPDFLRQLVEKHLLGQVNYTPFQPSLTVFRVGGRVPQLRLVPVGRQENQVFEGIAEPNATIVFFTAQCASCRLPEYIQRLEKLQGQVSAEEHLYAVFSSTFPVRELEYYQRTKFPQLEVYRSLDEIQGLEDRYATRYPTDWGPVVVRTGRDGKIISVGRLPEDDLARSAVSRSNRRSRRIGG